MKVKIWDKISAINGVKAEEIINTMNFLDDENIILINDDITDNTLYIEREITLRQILQAPYEIPVERVGELYVERMEEQARQQRQEQTSLKDLEEQNAIIIHALVKGGIM